MPQTASWIEMFEAVTNIAGIGMTVLMVNRTMRRHAAVRSMPDYVPNGPRVLVAYKHLLCEIGRMAYHGYSLLIGGWSMLMIDPSTSYAYTVMTGRVVLGVVFLIFSVFDWWIDERIGHVLTGRRERGV